MVCHHPSRNEFVPSCEDTILEVKVSKELLIPGEAAQECAGTIKLAQMNRKKDVVHRRDRLCDGYESLPK
jgi:hypothetical protein